MMIRILVSMLFFMSLAGMDKATANSDLASEQLYGLMARVYSKVNNRSFNSLIGLPEEPFDPSEQSIIPKVQVLLSKGADPDNNLIFKLPMPGDIGMKLPTSMEFAQQLGYKKVEILFLLSGVCK